MLNDHVGFVILSKALSFSESAHVMSVTRPRVSRQTRSLRMRLSPLLEDTLLTDGTYAIMPELSVIEALASRRLRVPCLHAFHTPLLVSVRENALMESMSQTPLRHLLDGF